MNVINIFSAIALCTLTNVHFIFGMEEEKGQPLVKHHNRKSAFQSDKDPKELVVEKYDNWEMIKCFQEAKLALNPDGFFRQYKILQYIISILKHDYSPKKQKEICDVLRKEINEEAKRGESLNFFKKNSIKTNDDAFKKSLKTFIVLLRNDESLEALINSISNLSMNKNIEEIGYDKDQQELIIENYNNVEIINCFQKAGLDFNPTCVQYKILQYIISILKHDYSPEKQKEICDVLRKEINREAKRGESIAFFNKNSIKTICHTFKSNLKHFIMLLKNDESLETLIKSISEMFDTENKHIPDLLMDKNIEEIGYDKDQQELIVENYNNWEMIKCFQKAGLNFNSSISAKYKILQYIFSILKHNRSPEKQKEICRVLRKEINREAKWGESEDFFRKHGIKTNDNSLKPSLKKFISLLRNDESLEKLINSISEMFDIKDNCNFDVSGDKNIENIRYNGKELSKYCKKSGLIFKNDYLNSCMLEIIKILKVNPSEDKQNEIIHFFSAGMKNEDTSWCMDFFKTNYLGKSREEYSRFCKNAEFFLKNNELGDENKIRDFIKDVTEHIDEIAYTDIKGEIQPKPYNKYMVNKYFEKAGLLFHNTPKFDWFLKSILCILSLDSSENKQKEIINLIINQENNKNIIHFLKKNNIVINKWTVERSSKAFFQRYKDLDKKKWTLLIKNIAENTDKLLQEDNVSIDLPIEEVGKSKIIWDIPNRFLPEKYRYYAQLPIISEPEIAVKKESKDYLFTNIDSLDLGHHGHIKRIPLLNGVFYTKSDIEPVSFVLPDFRKSNLTAILVQRALKDIQIPEFINHQDVIFIVPYEKFKRSSCQSLLKSGFHIFQTKKRVNHPILTALNLADALNYNGILTVMDDDIEKISIYSDESYFKIYKDIEKNTAIPRIGLIEETPMNILGEKDKIKYSWQDNNRKNSFTSGIRYYNIKELKYKLDIFNKDKIEKKSFSYFFCDPRFFPEEIFHQLMLSTPNFGILQRDGLRFSRVLSRSVPTKDIRDTIQFDCTQETDKLRLSVYNTLKDNAVTFLKKRKKDLKKLKEIDLGAIQAKAHVHYQITQEIPPLQKHQKEALKFIDNFLKCNDKGAIIGMTTGSGKTRVAIETLLKVEKNTNREFLLDEPNFNSQKNISNDENDADMDLEFPYAESREEEKIPLNQEPNASQDRSFNWNDSPQSGKNRDNHPYLGHKGSPTSFSPNLLMNQDSLDLPLNEDHMSENEGIFFYDEKNRIQDQKDDFNENIFEQGIEPEHNIDDNPERIDFNLEDLLDWNDEKFEEIHKKNAIVITPKIELTMQFYQELYKHYFNEKKDINKLFSIATDPKSVTLKHIFQNQRIKDGGYTIIFCAHSFSQMLNSLEQSCEDIHNFVTNLLRPSILIIDEVHKMYPGTKDYIHQYFSNVPRLGFSATPMDNDLFGNNQFTYPIAQGIEDNVIVDYTTHIIPHINGSIQEHNSEDILDTLKKYNLIDKRGIVYVLSIKIAQKLSEELNKENFIVKDYHSKIEQKIKNKILKDFKTGKVNLLIAVRTLREGYNDNIQYIIDGQDHRKEQDMKQMLGRSLRKDPLNPEKKAIVFVVNESIKNAYDQFKKEHNPILKELKNDESQLRKRIFPEIDSQSKVSIYSKKSEEKSHLKKREEKKIEKIQTKPSNQVVIDKSPSISSKNASLGDSGYQNIQSFDNFDKKTICLYKRDQPSASLN